MVIGVSCSVCVWCSHILKCAPSLRVRPVMRPSLALYGSRFFFLLFLDVSNLLQTVGGLSLDLLAHHLKGNNLKTKNKKIPQRKDSGLYVQANNPKKKKNNPRSSERLCVCVCVPCPSVVFDSLNSSHSLKQITLHEFHGLPQPTPISSLLLLLLKHGTRLIFLETLRVI